MNPDPLNPDSLDRPDKYARSWEQLPDLCLRIAAIRDEIQQLCLKMGNHPAAVDHFRNAMTLLDQAALKLHLGGNL